MSFLCVIFNQVEFIPVNTSLVPANKIKEEIMILILFVLILLTYQLEDQMDFVKFLFLFVLDFS